jgi:hypothetical protein
MNREQRRHPDQQPADRQPANPHPSPADQMRGDDRPQDALDPRAKNSGHGKKTADKWNQ